MSELAQRILPMKTAGTEHFIERTYRESGTHQWVRETYKNAEEAGATRVEYGIEWQAVESLGVHRRLIADNGKGMTSEELVAFFNTFGGGGKPIGGPHENFGVGAKTSLLPWNRAGVVVISWVAGSPSMIWVQHDPVTGEYGLRLEDVVDDKGRPSIDEVYAPYEDEASGCDWNAVKPPWIDDHGTVIVLLGNDLSENTVLGDPGRAESDTKGISSYLNRRVWDIPESVEVYVDELRYQDRNQWPPNEAVAHGPQASSGPDRRTNHRRIRGAKHYIEYPAESFSGGSIDSSGAVELSDGTVIDWYLWKGERPFIHMYAAKTGYIAALYDNELFDASAHQSRYRSFGVTEPAVKQKLWLIAKPPAVGGVGGAQGVYPNTSRNALLLLGGIDAGAPLPMSQWAEEFASKMPAEIVNAIQAARTDNGGTITDTTWRDRLAERFGSRWRIPKLRERQGADLTLDPTQGGSISKSTAKRKTKGTVSRGKTGGTAGIANTGSSAGTSDAVSTSVGGGLPNFRPVLSDQLSEGMMACWSPNDPLEKSGVVLINVEHPVLKAQIEHWQSQYADIHADDVQKEVVKVYGEMAVAKIAHSEHMKGIIPSKSVEDNLRSEEALTMSLLGLIGEEAILAPRIGGKLGKTK